MRDTRQGAMEIRKTAVRFTHIPAARLRKPTALFPDQEKKWQIGTACAMVESSNQNQMAGASLFAMKEITQGIQFKQPAIEYILCFVI